MSCNTCLPVYINFCTNTDCEFTSLTKEGVVLEDNDFSKLRVNFLNSVIYVPVVVEDNKIVFVSSKLNEDYYYTGDLLKSDNTLVLANISFTIKPFYNV